MHNQLYFKTFNIKVTPLQFSNSDWYGKDFNCDRNTQPDGQKLPFSIVLIFFRFHQTTMALLLVMSPWVKTYDLHTLISDLLWTAIK